MEINQFKMQLGLLPPDSWTVKRATESVIELFQLEESEVVVDKVNKIIYCPSAVYERLTTLNLNPHFEGGHNG